VKVFPQFLVPETEPRQVEILFVLGPRRVLVRSAEPLPARAQKQLQALVPRPPEQASLPCAVAPFFSECNPTRRVRLKGLLKAKLSWPQLKTVLPRRQSQLQRKRRKIPVSSLPLQRTPLGCHRFGRSALGGAFALVLVQDLLSQPQIPGRGLHVLVRANVLKRAFERQL